MTNPTSNYNFQMPTATDLVTDLPADFEVFGQAVDTRLKALQPGTTLGDLVYSSATANTSTRLGIGSSAQVLTVAGGVPTWATPAAGGGKMAQCLSTTKTDTFSASLSSGTSTNVTGLAQAITPSSATSKILVTLVINGFNVNYGGFSAAIARGSTLIGIGDAASARSRVGSGTSILDINHLGQVTCQFLDSPATTSSTTYNAYVFNTQSTTRSVLVNRTDADSDAIDQIRTASTITVMEILA
jgi:hypothetical protein